jgi:hypothetical protein
MRERTVAACTQYRPRDREALRDGRKLHPGFEGGSCRVPGCCQAEELLVLLTSF